MPVLVHRMLMKYTLLQHVLSIKYSATTSSDVVAVVYHISWATAQAGPSENVGGLMGTVDVVIVAVVHEIAWAAVCVGPSKHVGRLMGRAERPIYSPHVMSRDPARPIKF